MAAESIESVIEYPESDGQPMAETDLHLMLMVHARLALLNHFSKRSDVYVSGNLFVYYEEGNPGACLAPDCFVVTGVPAGDRRTFKVWEEGKFPDFVLEITSRKTRGEDTGKKRRIFQEIWKVKEYFLFDPCEEYLRPSFQGYRQAADGEYTTLEPSHGQFFSEVLNLKLERAGTHLVFRDPDTGHEVLSAEGERVRQMELELQLAEERIESLADSIDTTKEEAWIDRQSRQEAEAAKQAAEVQAALEKKAREDAEAQIERQAREAEITILKAELEIARLKAELQALRQGKDS